MVLLYHASGFMQAPDYYGYVPLFGVFDWGDAGVDFFFVLSGFIIYYVNHDSLGRRSGIVAYLWKRFSRVYPIYWILTLPMLAAYLFLPISQQGYETETRTIVGSFLLLPLSDYPILPVAWTLTFEVFFYAVFAICFVKREFGFALIIGWQLATLANLAFGFASQGWIGFVLNPLNLHFGLGILAAVTFIRFPLRRSAVIVAISLLALVAMGLSSVFLEIHRGPFWRLAFGVLVAVTIAGLASRERAGGLEIPRFALLAGAASYSIYLLHYPLELILVKGFKALEGHVSVSAGMVFILIAAIPFFAALVLHLRIERPVTSTFRRMFLGAPSATGVVGPPSPT
ncbi:MAG: acyltransferase [Alphaproteobacteria bacterium]|nr:acyltransferase [Alphaproteobacteria bacterium]